MTCVSQLNSILITKNTFFSSKATLERAGSIGPRKTAAPPPAAGAKTASEGGDVGALDMRPLQQVSESKNARGTECGCRVILEVAIGMGDNYNAMVGGKGGVLECELKRCGHRWRCGCSTSDGKNARTCSICGEKLTTNVSAARRDVSVQTIFNHTMAANHTSDWEHCTAGVRSRS